MAGEGKNKIWIVTELFYPDETSTAFILTKIANALSESHDVNVICGPSSYSGDSLSVTSSGNYLDSRVVVHRVSDTKLDKNRLISRILRFFVITFKLTRSLKCKVQAGDDIFVVTNPAPILLTVSRIKKRKNCRLTLLVHDVFPENTIPAGIIKSSDSLFYRILKRIFDSAYKSADKLIVIGRDMKEVVCSKVGSDDSEKVEIIENWGETETITPEYEQHEKINIQYAGNLGRVQGLMNLLGYINDASNPNLSFSFWGDGAVRGEMERFVSDNNLTDVSFHGSYRREDQKKIINSCDLAIVTLADGMYGLGVPSKTYNILAAGKPILFIGDPESEIALLIKENAIGYVFASGDVACITEFFKSLSESDRMLLADMGKRAREIVERDFSESTIMKKYIDLFSK